MMRPSFLRRVSRKLDKTLAGLFFIDQWVILSARGVRYDALRWKDFRAIVPDKDRYWGDPFIVQRGADYHVFVEEKMYATGRGRIACLRLNADGQLLSRQVVLERDYHLSYPFVFEEAGETYMIPETAERGTVDLYRCLHFPDQWEFSRTLLSGLYAVDATLLVHGGRHWLFANVRQEGGSSLNALHLFSADTLRADRWVPHPRNPVVQDLRSARPGGRIFLQDGKPIRPAQDSSRRYGYGLRFNCITKLTGHDYEESEVAHFEPPGGKLLATHTFNQAGQLTVIDAVMRRRK